jgi:4-amino-4-deoxy-L-arabinose transferase-like glycosyltransferase
MLLASCAFVSYYTAVSLQRFNAEHPKNGRILWVTDLVLNYGWLSYFVPLIVLISGVWLLRAKPDAGVFFELVIAVAWFLSFIWSGWSLVIWQLQNTPIIMHFESLN